MRRMLWIWILALPLAGPLHAQTLPTQAATEPATQPATQPSAAADPERIWAHRAARAEAIRKLIEQIKAMPLAGKARVGDFLAASPALEAALTGHLVGLPDAEPAEYAEGGACRVSLAIRVAEVAAALKHVRERFYRAEPFKDEDFGAIVGEGPDVLRQVGRSGPPPGLLEVPLIPYGAGRDYFARVGAPARKYWTEHVTNLGRRGAEEAALADATRRLAERVKDIPVGGQTRLADFVARWAGQSQIDPGQFLRGMRVLGARHYGDALVVEMDVEISLRTVYAALKNRLHQLPRIPPEQVRQVEQLIVSAAGSIRQTGMGCPPVGQLRKLDPAALATLAMAASPPKWLDESLRRTGEAKIENANEPGSRQQAVLAAERDARMALAAAVAELKVTEALSVGQLARKDSALARNVLAWLHSARPAGEPKISEDGDVEAALELPLRPLWRLLLP